MLVITLDSINNLSANDIKDIDTDVNLETNNLPDVLVDTESDITDENLNTEFDKDKESLDT